MTSTATLKLKLAERKTKLWAGGGVINFPSYEGEFSVKLMCSRCGEVTTKARLRTKVICYNCKMSRIKKAALNLYHLQKMDEQDKTLETAGTEPESTQPTESTEVAEEAKTDL